MKIKTLVLAILSSLIIVGFSGCGKASYGVPAKEESVNIKKDGTKSYITFGVEKIGYYAPLLEYIPQSDSFKHVTIIKPEEKYIYEVDEGEHYFYSMAGEDYDFIKVNVEKGKMYYINIDSVFWSMKFSMTAPIFFIPVTDKNELDTFENKQLISNTQKIKEWFDKRIHDPEFKEDFQERFLEWKDEDMEEKTLSKGFNL